MSACNSSSREAEPDTSMTYWLASLVESMSPRQGKTLVSEKQGGYTRGMMLKLTSGSTGTHMAPHMYTEREGVGGGESREAKAVPALLCGWSSAKPGRGAGENNNKSAHCVSPCKPV